MKELLNQLQIIAHVLDGKTEEPNSVALEVYPDGGGLVSHVIFREEHMPSVVTTLFTFKDEPDLQDKLRECVATIATRRTNILA